MLNRHGFPRCPPTRKGPRRWLTVTTFAAQLEFGDSVDVDGVLLVVSGVDPVEEGGAFGSGATVSLTVWAENRSESAKPLPGVEVMCLSGSEVGAGMAGGLGATYEPRADLPVGERVEGTLSVAVPTECMSPAAWPEGGVSAFWLLPATAVREPAVQLAHEMIDALDVSAEVRTCMHDVVSDFRLSEADAQEFGTLDTVASKGEERAIQIMLDFQTALATCN